MKLGLFEKKDDQENVLSEDDYSRFDQLARSQQKAEHELTKWEAAKAYPCTIGFLLISIWTMILVGYEHQAPGMVVSIPEFRKDFGYEYNGAYVLPAQWQSAMTGGPVGAMAMGVIAGSLLSDRFGRKTVLFFSALVSVPFVTAEFVATNLHVFFAGKILNGFVLGLLSVSCNSYTSECAPMALRGVFVASLSLSLSVGPFVCVLINSTTSTYTNRWAYRAIFIPQWIFSITATALILLLPESPYWLISKGRYKAAQRSLKRMYREDSLAERQYALMYVTVQESAVVSSQQRRFIDCFRGTDLRRTLIVTFTMFMQSMSGVSYVSNYSTYYYELAGASTHKAFQISCGAQALSISGVISSWFIIDRFGRRRLMLTGVVMICVLNLIVACTGLDKKNQSALKVSTAFMAMYDFFYNVSFGPIPYILAGEVSSVFLRAKTYAVANLANNCFQCMWSFVLPYMFNPDHADMGSKINFIFTGTTFLSFFVFYFILPETAHRSFEEIDEMFEKRVPAKEWRFYVTDKQTESETAAEEVEIISIHNDGKEVSSHEDEK